MSQPPRPRRPARRPTEWLDAAGDTHDDPAAITEIAHATAAALVDSGRASQDPAVTAKLVALVDEIGLGTIAELWAQRPARSLPGALWRLYVLREWVRRNPGEIAGDYAAGMPHTEVSRAIAGVIEPPGPSELRELADQILAGVFDGDLAVALARAAAFCRICSTGKAYRAQDVPAGQGALLTRRSGDLLRTAEDLSACARLWIHGELI